MTRAEKEKGSIINPWADIIGIAGIASGNEILKILSILLKKIEEGEQDNTLLSEIDTNVRKSMQVSFSSGKDFLHDAMVAEIPKNREKYLDDARKSFIDASNISPNPYNFEAMEYVAICYNLLKEKNLSMQWYQKAYSKLLEERQNIHDELKRLEEKSRGFFVGQGKSDKLRNSRMDLLPTLFAIESQIYHLSSYLNIPLNESMFFVPNLSKIEWHYLTVVHHIRGGYGWYYLVNIFNDKNEIIQQIKI